MKFLSPVLHVTGLLIAGLGIAMLLPALFDAVRGNPDWQIFVVSAIFTWTFGSLMALATRGGGAMRLSVRHAFLTTAVVWISLSAFSALPFLGLGLDYDDSLFEAVSGFTTTGSTVIVGLDTLPPGILLWRALLQWIGGIGIVVMAIIILPFLRVGGMQLFHAESSDRSEKIVARPLHLVGFIGSIYVGLTVACAVCYMFAGMTPFDAMCHAMSTVSTGGFANYDSSFGHYQSARVDWFAIVFMMAGALPFVAYIKAIKGAPAGLWHDSQIRTFVTFVVVVGLLLGVWLSRTTGLGVGESVRLAMFNVVSIVTTTGFVDGDYTLWGTLAVGLFFLLTFVGGCSGSTAGGIKIYRFEVLSIIVRSHIRRLVIPNRVVTMRYGGRRLPPDVPSSVLAFLAVYIGTTGLFTLLLAATGLDFVTALSSAAQAIGNVGPGLGPVVGPSGNYASVPDPAKWVLSAAMLLGRLELFTLIVLLDPDFWRG
ncbi:TrkH family potassium uptake protein [Microbaculum marinum]|uniref:Trk system potassium uptake protein n=1 Tax=Microbaculum marinum TaxID=1764581 RepID=A0AAW9S303_9HYPH